MFRRRKHVTIETERLILRPPQPSDQSCWMDLRKASTEFLTPWEPKWSNDHLSRRAFSNRIYWAERTITAGTGLPVFLFRRDDNQLVGAITLDNIRRGPAQAGTLGYWIGKSYARQGLMKESIPAVVHYAFTTMDLSRVEAACLPENTASRGVLERTGFKYEGVAQSYLQIAGRWRTHVLYANLRADRRGRTEAG